MGLIAIPVTTTGSAGSATGSVTSPPVYGYWTAIKWDFHTSAPNTTTGTVTEADGMKRTLFTKSAGNTDAVYYPMVEANNLDGSAVATELIDIAPTRVYLSGERLTVAIANSDALTGAVVVYIQTEDMPHVS